MRTKKGDVLTFVVYKDKLGMWSWKAHTASNSNTTVDFLHSYATQIAARKALTRFLTAMQEEAFSIQEPANKKAGTLGSSAASP